MSTARVEGPSFASKLIDDVDLSPSCAINAQNE